MNRISNGKATLYYGTNGTGKTTKIVELAIADTISDSFPNSIVISPNRYSLKVLKNKFQNFLSNNKNYQNKLLSRDINFLSSLQTFYNYLLSSFAKKHSSRLPIFVSKDLQIKIIIEVIKNNNRYQQLVKEASEANNYFFFAVQILKIIERLQMGDYNAAALMKLGQEYTNSQWEIIAEIWLEYEALLKLRFSTINQSDRKLPGYMTSATIPRIIEDCLVKDPTIITDSALKYLYLDDCQYLTTKELNIFEKLHHIGCKVCFSGNFNTYFEKNQLLAQSPNLSDFSKDTWKKVELKYLYRYETALLPLVESYNREAPPLAEKTLHNSDKKLTYLKLRTFADNSTQLKNIATQIIELTDQGVSWSEIAIITKDIESIKLELKAILNQYKIPFHFEEDYYQLSKNTLIKDIVAWLNYLDNRQESNFIPLLTTIFSSLDYLDLRNLQISLIKANNLNGSLTVNDFLYKFFTSELTIESKNSFCSEKLTRKLFLLKEFHDNLLVTWRNSASISDLLSQMWLSSGLEKEFLKTETGQEFMDEFHEQSIVCLNYLFQLANNFEYDGKGSSLSLFIEEIKGARVANASTNPSNSGQPTVRILSPIQAVGHEWDYLFLCGVQDKTWPKITNQFKIFSQDKLYALLTGISDRVIDVLDSYKEQISRERNLFAYTAGRASKGLVITAVDSQDSFSEMQSPSRFLLELNNILHIKVHERDLGITLLNDIPITAQETDINQMLTLKEIVISIRQSLLSNNNPNKTNMELARLLKVLAQQGISIANPDNWYGWSNKVEQSQGISLATVSPSFLVNVFDCNLGGLVKKFFPSNMNQVALELGSFIHDLISQVELTTLSRKEKLLTFLDSYYTNKNWYTDQQTTRYLRMLDNYAKWKNIHKNRSEKVQTEEELILDVNNHLKIIGRIDRLDTNRNGEVTITDFKTSRQALSHSAAEEDIQLFAYQLALNSKSLPVAGARLVYLDQPSVKTGLVERTQSAKSKEEKIAFLNSIAELNKQLSSGEITLSRNKHCSSCPIRSTCPLYEGI